MAQRFASSRGSAQIMTETRFSAVHEGWLRDHANKPFRRIDLNVDDGLSRAAFRAPLRARFGTALTRLCREADLNKDGKQIRAEFDEAVADKYGAAAKGGAGMTLAKFYELEKMHHPKREALRFKRLDKNLNGKLSETEFAAPGNRLFARLEVNKDGVVTRAKLTVPRHRHHGRGKGPR